MKRSAFFNYRKVSFKVYLAFALLILFGLLFLFIQRISYLNQSAEKVNHSYKMRLAISETLSRLNDAEAGPRGFLLTNDSTFLTVYSNSEQGLLLCLKQLRSLVRKNPEQLQQVNSLEELVYQRQRLIHSLLYQNKQHVFTPGELDAMKTHLAHMDLTEQQTLNANSAKRDYFIFTIPLFAAVLTVSAIFIILLGFIQLLIQLHRSYKKGKKSEEEASRAHALLENAEQIASIASWQWNLATQHIDRSNNLYRLYGYEPGSPEFSTDHFLSLIDGNDRNRLIEKLQDFRRKGMPSCTCHFWVRRRDGEQRFFESIGHFSKNEKGEDIITGTTQDITEEHMLRQEAQQRAYLLEQVIDHNVDLIGVMDSEMRVQLWNKAYEEAFGISRQEILGKKLTDYFPYLENNPKIILTRAALEGKETIRQQLPYDKDNRTGEISFIPLKDTNGKVQRVLTIIHDISEIKKANELLNESNERFRQAEIAGKLGSYYLNMKTGEIIVSENLYHIFGVEPGSKKPELESFYDMVHPEDRAKTLEAIHQNVASGAYNPLYYRIIRKDGCIRHIKAFVLPTLNEYGGTILYGSLQDITDEEVLKQQLEQRSALLESIIENSTEFIVVIDKDLRYTLLNKTHADALRLNRDEVIGKKITEIFPSIEGHPNFGMIQECLKGKSSYMQEFTDPQSGVTAEINHIPLKDKEGNVTGLLVVSHDITERKLSAQKLEKANKELNIRNEALLEAYSLNQHITDLAPNGIYVYDKNKGTTVFTNKKMLDLHGYSVKELNDMGIDTFNNLVHPEDLPYLFNCIAGFATANDDDVVELVFRMRNKNGHYRHVICREAIFKRNEKGVPEQFIGVAIDVTELKKAEKELNEKNRELLQTNEELASFNYMASHDLQEPLRKIHTFCDFLEHTEQGLSENGINYLKRMEASVIQMRALIHDLLSFSRIEMVKNEREHVDLNQILEEAKTTLSISISERGAQVISDVLPVIEGSSFQLQRLFENLLSNAIKYCRPGVIPRITIECKEFSKGKTTYNNSFPGQSYIHLSIKDNGIGFDQEYAEKIFELFHRLHTKNEYPGTGLGLSICKKIVQNHSGQIQASSIPGEGSVFEISLPISEASFD